FFQAEDGIRDFHVTGVQTCALPISTMGDVEVGCVVEIKSGALFLASRDGHLEPEPLLSRNTDLSRMFWTYGLRGRPVRVIAEVEIGRASCRERVKVRGGVS